MLIHGMHGLGDNLYQRCVIREVPGDVILMTPWPQIYADLPIRCLPAKSTLRTQAKNERRSVFSRMLVGRPAKRWHYVSSDAPIPQALAAQFGVTPRVFDGPPVVAPSREPYIVVRPATIRKEWRADSRNPHAGYIDRAVQALRGRFRIVSVADLRDGEEWPSEPLPYADERYHEGQLPVEQLLGLVAGAAGVVGGVGWAVPAAVAYRVPMLLLFGGWGKHNGPARIFGRPMDISQIDKVFPDAFCMCSSYAHACNKRVSNIDARVDAFALRLTQGRAPAMAA